MNSDLKKDMKKISMIDYNRINAVDDTDKMMQSAFMAHSHIMSNRINLILKQVLTEDDYNKTRDLERRGQKEILHVFLNERGISVVAIHKDHVMDSDYLNSFYDIYFHFIRESDGEKLELKVSYISEEEFRTNLSDFKDLLNE